jgi:tetratricopeptide (TPR) repeat protein
MRSPLICIATFVAMTSLVLADPPRRNEDPRQLAREHVIAARTLHAQHRLLEALSELEAAYALDPQPQLLFAMGQLHVQAGRCERAIAFYQRFLASKPKPIEAAIAREAIQTCKTAPPPPAIDPAQQPPREPGPRSTRDATPPRTLDSLPITDAPPPPAPPAVTTGPSTPTESPQPARRHGSRAGYVVAGSLTAAAVGAAAGSFLLYRGALDDREAAASARSYDAYEDLVARSDRRHKLSLVVGAGGAAALTSGVIVFVLSRRSGPRPPTTAFQVTVSPSGAIATWRAPF